MNQPSNRRVHPLTLATAAGLLAGVLAAPASVLAQPFSWASAVNGNWFDNTKWIPNSVPNAPTAAVTLGLSGAYTTTLQNNTATIATLAVTNPAAILALFDNDNLIVSGTTITNAGLIQISNPSAPGNATRITMNSPVAISGSGTLRLAAPGTGDGTACYLDYAAAPDILTNASGHTVAGQGRVYAGLVNNGIVNADQSGGLLIMLDQPKTNNATMEATNGGQLWLRGIALTQGGSGVLQSAGTNSAVVLQTANVNGGSLPTGFVVTSGGTINSLDNFTVAAPGTVQINDNTDLVVSSNILNNGLFTISAPGAPGNATRITAGAPFAFNGSGLVRIQGPGTGDSTSAYLDYSVAADTISNASSHTIAGYGRIYTGLTNAGAVNADQNGTFLVMLDQAKSNTGVMQALNGGTLIFRTSLTQTGTGHLQATGAGSSVWMQNASISGGSMATGLLQTINGTSNTLDSFTIAAPASLLVNDNTLIDVGAGGITNNGSIAIDTVGAPGNATRIVVNASAVALNGSGNLRLNATGNFNNSAYLDYGLAANVLTQASTHSLFGVGRIFPNFVNNGLVNADTNVSGRNVLELLDQPKTNNNQMKATGGGQIWISSDSVTQSPTATLEADAGSAVVFNNATIDGGLLTTTGSGQFATNGGTTNAIDGVTLTAGTSLVVNDNSTLLARTSLADNGTITIDTIGAPGNVSRLMCDSPAVTISGSGTIRMQATSDFSDTAYIWQTGTDVFTQAAGHTIAGNGRLYNGLINNGTVVADVSVAGREVLQFLDQPKTNNSLIHATGGGQVWVTSTTVSQSPGGQFVCDSGSTVVLQNGTISGGTLVSSGTGVFQTANGSSSTLDNLTLSSGSTLQINDNTTVSLGTNGVVNNGTIIVDTVGAPGNATRILAPSTSSISGVGSIKLQATGFANDSAYIWAQGDAAHPLTIGAGQTLSGAGRLYGNIVSQGKITPSQPFGTPGSVGQIGALSGSLTMAATSSYDVQAASAGSYDNITGNDTIVQAGALTVITKGTYVPDGQDYFDIVTGGSITGRFNPVTLPAVGSFGPAHVVYLPTVTRVSMCYANCDGSNTQPILNVNDFGCFLNAYAAGDPYANCDGSTTPPVLNVLDFACFLNKYAAGCP